MKWSQHGWFPTLRESPRNVEVASHRLLLRGGFIRMVGAGVYAYLPLGLKVLRKIEHIVREEMERINVLEALMPILVPETILKKTNRIKMFGDVLLKAGNEKFLFYLGPTHEENFTHVVGLDFQSQKDLPIALYQIAVKFRNELRPRHGLIRTREFCMYDGYSFHEDEECLDRFYNLFKLAYARIFKRLGLDIVVAGADSGAMGGSSEEFVMLDEHGEDFVALCSDCSYASNLENATSVPQEHSKNVQEEPLELVDTGDNYSIEAVAKYLNVEIEKCIKCLLFRVSDGTLVLFCIRGDHTLNVVKASGLLKQDIVPLSDVSIAEKGWILGVIGPVRNTLPDFGIRMVCDESLRDVKGYVVGSNQKDMHFLNFSATRDFPVSVEFANIRNVLDGDGCLKCSKGKISLRRCMELGHVFKLGDKYSRNLQLKYNDKSGNENYPLMGCYGLGMTRMLSAIVEKYCDTDGIAWPKAVAPFQVLFLTATRLDSQRLLLLDEFYDRLKQKGISVLLDDRDVSAGIKFKDADLMGIPLRVVFGKTWLQRDKVDISSRDGSFREEVDCTSFVAMLSELV